MSENKIFIADKPTQEIIKRNTELILEKVHIIIRNSHKRYGVRIDKNDSNPDTRIKYIYDAVGMKPAAMNYQTRVFDYGDWQDVFFVEGNYPCMLKNDGTEAYRLNPNDYSKKEDGSDSDVANVDFSGNAMSAIPLVWVSQYQKGNYEYMIVCDMKYDESYHAYLHTRIDGTIADVFYERMFKVSGLFNQKLRSISGATSRANNIFQNGLNAARLNGSKWGLSRFASWNLFEVLLKIMSKTEDSQMAFGYGKSYAMKVGVTGTLNDKGAFYGYNGYLNEYNKQFSVKVFHCEDWWGESSELREGLINIKGRLVQKATPPFNLTGEGYKEVLTYSSQGGRGGFVSKTLMTDAGRFPIEFAGSESTFTCDNQSVSWDEAQARGYVATGGGITDGGRNGCSAMSVYYGMGTITRQLSLSCEQPFQEGVMEV